MNTLDKRLDEYADLLIRIGLNLQKGQTLLIACPVDCAFFARKCAAAAYAAGCREVVMNWRDDALTRMRYLYADTTVFDSTAAWQKQLFNGYAEEGAAYLAISASDPMSLAGVDADRLSRAKRASGRDLAIFHRAQMVNDFPWCIASVPIPAWAGKVFPDLDADAAMEALWEAIFRSVRISGNGDAVEKWREHLDRLGARMQALNDYRFVSLHYQNALGTDFTVRLPEGHIWQGGADTARAGFPFIANMPTEEIFTAPDCRTGDGVICASMPLVHDGNIIRDIRFVVRDGKIVEATAGEGQEVLRAAIAVDEGACRFGELALVPYDSPISNQKILFYNTLFDENAACHIAFGDAYPCVEGGNALSDEALQARGLNHSITHVDFMIGTKDLSITGTCADGREVPIFRDGNFAL